MARLQAENATVMTELARLQLENEKLTAKVQECQFGEHFLKGDQGDARTLHFTGLDCHRMRCLYGWLTTVQPSYLSNVITCTCKCSSVDIDEVAAQLAIHRYCFSISCVSWSRV